MVQHGARYAQSASRYDAAVKTIGLIGGMSWESTVLYYRAINRGMNERLGGQHSARIVLYSVDFDEIQRLQHAGDWDAAGRRLASAAAALEAAGADFLLLCTNTMHRVLAAVEAAVAIPVLHIVDPTAERIRAQGLRRVGLVGTRFTMEQDFYRGRLAERHGLTALVPDPDEREVVHRVIYDELVRGHIREESREAYRAILAHLVERGARGVILGCTEIGLLVGAADVAVPIFDTTRIHAEAAVDAALA